MSRRRRRKDHRREWALWIAMAADHCGVPTVDAFAMIEEFIIDPPEENDPDKVSAYYRIPRMEDHLPSQIAWLDRRAEVHELVVLLDTHREAIDAEIKSVSPRWRLDRMPVVDRNLLRLGITEILYMAEVSPRSSINGCVELAKSYGEDRTRKFVNGILDQVRRNHGLPFS